MTKILNPQIYKTSLVDYLIGGKIYTYVADTDTPKVTYQTITDAKKLKNPNTNPIILDSKGRARIVTNGPTKLVLKDADDNTIWTVNDLDVSILDRIDDSGNEVLVFNSVANAVNGMEIRNAVTGSAPRISALGDDGNIDFHIKPKGTGSVNVTIGGIRLEQGNLTITAGSATLVSGDLNMQVGTLTVDTLASVPHTSFTLVDSGTIAWFAGSAAPTGWLECNGGAVSRSTYADLFAIVGSTFGVGDGSTTFNLPAQARNVLVGKGGSGTGTLGNTSGSTGGEEAHALVSSEIPSHSHSYEIGEISSWAYSGSTYTAPGEIIAIASASTGSTGTGTAYNIMQPGLVMMMIIKT